MNIALAISIGLTTIWEESVIAHLAPETSQPREFYGPVLRANLVTMALLMAFAAAKALPGRIGTEGFLGMILNGLRALA